MVIQLLSCVQLFATPWAAASQASLSFTISESLLKLMSIESMMLSTISFSVTHFSAFPQFFPLSQLFSNESALCIRWPKYQSFSFNISPSNEYSGLISLRIDWFDLLAVHLHQFKSINSSMLSFLYSPALTSTQDY